MSDNVTLTPEEQAQLEEQRKAAPAETESVEEVVPQEEAPAEPEITEEAPAEKHTVPLATLKEERERRKQLEREFAEKERRWEERFAMVVQKFGQPEQKTETQGPTIPPLAEDPAAHIIGTMQAQGADVQQIKQALGEYHAQQQRAQAVAQIQQRAVAQEAEFRAEQQDYDAAVNFLKDFRNRQLAAAGVGDAGQRHAQILEESFQIAVHAMRNNKNVGEIIYELAKASGYTPAQPEPGPAERIATVARGQAQSRGLGNVRGSGPTPMSAQKLMEMSPDEFLKVMETSSDARKLLGA